MLNACVTILLRRWKMSCAKRCLVWHALKWNLTFFFRFLAVSVAQDGMSTPDANLIKFLHLQFTNCDLVNTHACRKWIKQTLLKSFYLVFASKRKDPTCKFLLNWPLEQKIETCTFQGNKSMLHTATVRTVGDFWHFSFHWCTDCRERCKSARFKKSVALPYIFLIGASFIHLLIFFTESDQTYPINWCV